MVEYSCEICGKNFGNRKSHYITHKNKKYPCLNKVEIAPKIKEPEIIAPNIKNFEIISNEKIDINKQDLTIINNDVCIFDIVNDNNIDNENNNIDNKLPIYNTNKIICKYCSVSFSRNSNLNKHLKNSCKIKMQKDDEKINKFNNINELMNFNKQLIIQNNDIKIQNEELKNDLLKLSLKQIPKICTNIKKLEKTIPANSKFEISNQLVNKIIEKDKKIDELDRELNEIFEDSNKLKIKNNIIIVDDTLTNNQNYDKFNDIEELENKPINLILNNQIIQFREPDNYINATQLCKAGGKNFGHWNSLDSTKELISILASEIGIPISQLIDSKKGKSNNYEQGTWIHPDLAIQLAQWLSPHFAIQVSLWIRELFTKGNVSVNLKLLKEKENIIKDRDRRIKILEDLTLKRHARTKYSDSNVVYIITDDKNKKDRKYIIGSTIDLTDRLSTYNKDSEYEVIYYKGFENEEIMKKAEQMVILKLRKYQEKANRDRFILPAGENIKLFTDPIDKAFDYFN
jgi:hypothetical protein